MKVNHRVGRTTLATALVLLGASAAQAGTWPGDHLTTAYTWVHNPCIEVANNLWGSSPSVYYDANNKLHATTKCGSFTALLLKNGYPGVLTDTVLIALTGSNSPFADEWYAEILNETNDATSGIAFFRRDTVASIQPGDILASEYTTSGDTGHVMTVRESVLVASNLALPSDKQIPGVNLVNKYEVSVFDSTNSPHGSYAGNPKPDTRYRRFCNGTWALVTDTGIGSGTVVLYEDAATGALVAWAWNVSPTTASFYYAVTPNQGNFQYRPMVAGFLDGPGL
jgi:hypothetical protein